MLVKMGKNSEGNVLRVSGYYPEWNAETHKKLVSKVNASSS